jgi:hypothetical protein
MADNIKIRGTTLADYLEGKFTDEAQAASSAYDTGFPAMNTSLASAQQASNLRAADGTPLRPSAGVQDLRVDNLRALNKYAESLTDINLDTSADTPEFSAGGDRADDISTVQDPASFSPSANDNRDVLNAQTLRGNQVHLVQSPSRRKKIAEDLSSGNRNLDTLAGGGAAAYSDGIGTVMNRLGSFFGQDMLNELLSKSGAPGEPSSNYLLKNNAYAVSERVEKVLDKTNRFSPNEDASPYLNPASPGTNSALDGVDAKEPYNKGLYSVQTGRGSQALGTYDPNAPQVDLELLRSMALKVLLKSTGESAAASMIAEGDANGIDAGLLHTSVLAAIDRATDMNFLLGDASNSIQLGLGNVKVESLRIKGAIDGDVDTSLMTINRLMKSAGADDFLTEGAATSGDTSAPTSLTTIGNLNSFAEPFAGAFPIGMLNTVLVGLLSLVLVSAFVEFIAEHVSPDEDPKDKIRPGAPWKMAMGGNRPRGAGFELRDSFMRLLGMPRMKSDVWYPRAFSLGVQRFFGFNLDFKTFGANPASGLADLLEDAISVALSPGYYAVMQKVILRDATELGQLFASAFAANAKTILPGSGVSGALGLWSAFSALLESTTFKFVMICMALGDRAYDAKFDPGRTHAGHDLLTYEQQLQVNVLGPTNRMYINRFRSPTDSGASDGAVHSPLSLHLYSTLLLAPPADIEDGPLYNYGGLERRANYSEEGVMPVDQDLGGTLASTLSADNGGRFLRDTVQRYEDALDLEYTPFYVQDLRTNEIIAMPAFIDSVGESFSTEYNETHGYGRTDPVRSYTRTARNIDLSFTLAAMNARDHQLMWSVINKLVAMCYPQRSLGKQRFTPDGRGFIQPFSQIPTASPVVRLRLGELFHSNYSVEGLKRLFGAPDHIKLKAGSDVNYGDTEYWNNRNSSKVVAAAWARVRDDLKKAFRDAKGGVNTKVSYVASTGAYIYFATDPITQALRMLPLPAGPSNDSPFVGIKTQAEIAFKVKDGAPTKSEKGTLYYKVSLKFQSENHAKLALGLKRYERVFASGYEPSVDCYLNIARMAELEGDLGIVAPTSDGAVRDLVKKEIKTIDEVRNLSDSEFFSPDRNAIVRSFESSAGRGLAGVFTNMTLNYDGSLYGTDSASKNRAPKKVQITVAFAPIHDLPLGLDHAGHLIAPSHPVGPLNTLYKDPALEARQAADKDILPAGVTEAEPEETLLGAIGDLLGF